MEVARMKGKRRGRAGTEEVREIGRKRRRES